MGALGFDAFSGAECLTLNVSLCCAKTLTLIPTSMTVTANENLIFLDPLPAIPSSRNFETPIFRCTRLAIQRPSLSYVKPAAKGKHWPK